MAFTARYVVLFMDAVASQQPDLALFGMMGCLNLSIAFRCPYPRYHLLLAEADLAPL